MEGNLTEVMEYIDREVRMLLNGWRVPVIIKNARPKDGVWEFLVVAKWDAGQSRWVGRELLDVTP